MNTKNETKRPQWPFGFVFDVQLGLLQTRALIKTKKNKLLQVEQLWDKCGAMTAVHGLLRQVEHFLTDMINRVEHQKRNQPAIEKWPFGFVFGVQLGLRQTQALIKPKR